MARVCLLAEERLQGDIMDSTADRVLAALEAYGLKKEGGNQYRCKKGSPLRPGSDSDGFTLRIDDGEHGAWDDKVSGESGSLYELAERLGIEVPKARHQRHEVASTKRGYTGLEDYAKAHGVDIEIFQDAGWNETIYQQRRALSYPTHSGTRYRFIDGQKPTYINAQGYKACWYGLSKAVEKARAAKVPLVLCNGEASTVTAQFFGLPACAVTNGEKRYPEGLIEELKQKWDGGFILAFDCDDTGRRAAQDIAAQLVGRAVAVMDLGLTDSGDLADFCKLHDIDTWKAFWKSAPKPSVASQVELQQKASASELAATLQEIKATMARGEQAKQTQDLTLQLAKARALIDTLEAQSARPMVRTIEVVGDEALKQLDLMYNSGSKLLGLSWGFAGLNKITRGLRPATINVLYGATSMGKTALAASIVRELMPQGTGLIIPTETRAIGYMFRLAGTIARIPADKIEAGDLTPHEYQKARNVLAMLKSRGWQFLENPQPSLAQLRSAVLDAAAAGVKIIIIDSASRLANAADYSLTAGLHNAMQALAIETGLPFLLTSQVARDVSKRKNKLPRLTDAYGGGVIENNADFVLGLYRHDYYVAQYPDKVFPSYEFPENTGTGIVLKHRNGPGLGDFVRFAFVGGAGFYELETRRIEESA